MIKKIIVIFIFTLLVPAVLAETFMVLRYGLPPKEDISADFKYYYLDVYDKFFKKVHSGNQYIYIPQRLYGVFKHTKEFLVNKPPNTVRIFVLGGSVAHDFAIFPLDQVFKELIPDKNVEVINCGMDGYDSYRDILVEKEILSYSPDLIVVF